MNFVCRCSIRPHFSSAQIIRSPSDERIPVWKTLDRSCGKCVRVRVMSKLPDECGNHVLLVERVLERARKRWHMKITVIKNRISPGAGQIDVMLVRKTDRVINERELVIFPPPIAR